MNSMNTGTPSGTSISAILASVGGTPKPILHILHQYRPKHVWYVCSAGGYSEQLATARLAQRSRQRNGVDPAVLSGSSDLSEHIPHCPQCGALVTLRTAKTGRRAGTQFWGCTA